MPKIERIKDAQGSLPPLRLTRRNRRRLSCRRLIAPSVRIKCGCCSQAVVIFHDNEPWEDASQATLEINGVEGTVDQWRRVLLPLLGLEVPKA